MINVEISCGLMNDSNCLMSTLGCTTSSSFVTILIFENAYDLLVYYYHELPSAATDILQISPSYGQSLGTKRFYFLSVHRYFYV